MVPARGVHGSRVSVRYYNISREIYRAIYFLTCSEVRMRKTVKRPESEGRVTFSRSMVQFFSSGQTLPVNNVFIFYFKRCLFQRIRIWVIVECRGSYVEVGGRKSRYSSRLEENITFL